MNGSIDYTLMWLILGMAGAYAIGKRIGYIKGLEAGLREATEKLRGRKG